MKKVKSHYLLVPIVVFLVLLGACSDSAWDEVPSPIAAFIQQYFPGSTVSSYTTTDDGISIVKIRDGATLKFDSEQTWFSIDGNGVPLPQVIVYDQFPPALWTFLQGRELTEGVMSVTRDKYYYKVTMRDTVLTYDIATEETTYPPTQDE